MKISVVIPVGYNHRHLVPKAIHSVKLNRLTDTEVIVVNDHNSPFDLATINREGDTPYGPGKCRNLGTAIAQGECVVYLDADDMLIPGALDILWQKYEETGCIVYGDVIRSDTGYVQTPEPYYGDDIQQALGVARRPITCLYPKNIIEAVGGWEEEMLWEDIELELRTRVNGHCDVKVNYPIYWYNMTEGLRRKTVEESNAEKETVRQILYDKYNAYYKGEKKLMGCSSCGSKTNITVPTQSYSKQLEQINVQRTLSEGYIVELEYIGQDKNKRTYIGPSTGNRYVFGKSGAFIDSESGQRQRFSFRTVGTGKDQVHPADAQEMIKLRMRVMGGQFYLFKLNVKEPITIIEPPPADVEAVGAEKVEFSKVVEVSDEQAAMMEMALKQRLESRMKPVTNFSISAMKQEITKASEDEIRIWLKQENESEMPRKGMITLLEDHLPSPQIDETWVEEEVDETWLEGDDDA